MVPHLQDVHLEVRAAGHKVALGVGFHIACQQKAGRAVVDAQDDGGVVGFLILGHRAKHGHGGAAQRPLGAHCGHLDLEVLLLGVLDKILEALGGGLSHRAVDVVGREVGQRSGQTSHMVLVGVGAEDVFQLLDPLTLQVGDDQTAVVHIAAVIEHELSVALHQDTEGLPHIDEVHLEGGVLSVGRDGLGGGRVRDEVGAAAGEGGGGITAHKAQHKGRCKGQRRKPAHELSGGHFFFFEVFHDAFSFC